MPSALLNPDSAIRPQTTLEILKRDNTIIPVAEGAVVLQAGSNVVFSNSDPDSDEIILSVDQVSGTEDPYFRDKYNDMASMVEGALKDYLEPGEPGGACTDPNRFIEKYRSYCFTDQILWITKVTGNGPDEQSGAFFLTNTGCTSTGAFEQANYPEATEARLQVLDICLPCKDCLDYGRIYEYMERILEFYEYIHELAYNQDTDNPPEHPDGGVRDECSNFYFQLIALREYWNYLVHKSMVKFAIQGTGRAISLTGYYKNISPSTVSGMSFVFELTFAGFAGLSAASVDIFAMARDLSGSTTKVSAVLTSSGVTSNTITIEMEPPGDLDPGEAVHADVAIVFITATEYFTGAGVEVDAVMTALDTHLAAAQVKTGKMYFRPPDEPPPP